MNSARVENSKGPAVNQPSIVISPALPPGSFPTPGNPPTLPGNLPTSPGSFPTSPGSFPTLPGSFPTTGSISPSPGAFPSSPGNFQTSPGSLPTSPGSFSPPGSSPPSPGNYPAVSASLPGSVPPTNSNPSPELISAIQSTGTIGQSVQEQHTPPKFSGFNIFNNLNINHHKQPVSRYYHTPQHIPETRYKMAMFDYNFHSHNFIRK